jgi:hypothetical protein
VHHNYTAGESKEFIIGVPEKLGVKVVLKK